MRLYTPMLTLVLTWGWWGTSSASPCEYCPDGGAAQDAHVPVGSAQRGDCWSPELKRDLCNHPPKPCGRLEGATYVLEALSGSSAPNSITSRTPMTPGVVECVVLHLLQSSGYYRIYGIETARSGLSDRNESAYLTIQNRHNISGLPTEVNAALQGDAEGYFVIPDGDNQKACTTDLECDPGQICRSASPRVCVEGKPTFYGTFWLMKGEDNRVCVHHFCPIWNRAKAAGVRLGFIHEPDCSSPSGVAFTLNVGVLLCRDDRMLHPCTFGHDANGDCEKDPCDQKRCDPDFCKDGFCLTHNPCARLGCIYGCKNGRCLQSATANGPDRDRDGYSVAADCDDNDRNVHPMANEICGNGRDDDCDGAIDEASECAPKDAGPADGRGIDASPKDANAEDANAEDGGALTSPSIGGCGCAVEGPESTNPLMWICCLGLGLWIRRGMRSRR